MNDSETSWLADGVKEIERLAMDSINLEPKLLALPQEKPGAYAIVTPGKSGGTLVERVAKPTWHNETLETPGQLNAFIGALDELRSDAAKSADPGVVYVSKEQVTFCYSFEDRRDRAVVPLVISKPFAWLSTPSQSMDQKTLIRTLRIVFADCLPSDSNLISLLRSLRFTNNGEAQVDVQKGREAIGKNILNEVRGVDALPDEVVLTVPVFENTRSVVTIRCALEVYPDTQRFELIALPSQLHRGMTIALDDILSVVTANTNVKAFIGSVRKQIENN